MVHGDTCYGCRGTGLKLTKRGKAARAFFNESLLKPVAELKVGMLCWGEFLGSKPKWLPILDIKPSKACSIGPNGERTYYVEIQTSRGGFGVFPTSKVKVVANEEERQALLTAALAYQASLSKTGAPMKRLSAAA
jgi:hypothetical protein